MSSDLNEIYYKKASVKYCIDINFDLNETVSRAYIYWNLKLGFHNHNFFKYAINFSKKYTKLK